ncbi:MAG: YrdB family protein [Bacteroidota bacterium]
MGTNPINLIFRFLLELFALFTVGMWGWNQSDGWFRFVLALGIPVVLAIIWGTFAVPDDPSRSGKAPIVTPGIVRLIIELAIFGFAMWSLFDMGYTTLSWMMVIAVIVHYIVSYDRIKWLISRKK